MDRYSVSVPGGGSWTYSDRASAEKASSFLSGITGKDSFVTKESQALKDTSSPSGSGSGKTVICTYFMQKGVLARDLWKASAAYGRDPISPVTLRGYHTWAIPYVRLMRTSPMAERVMRPIMLARSEEIGYQMGIRDKPNYAGKAIRAVMEPLCYVIGLVAPQQDWESLWDPVTSTMGVRA